MKIDVGEEYEYALHTVHTYFLVHNNTHVKGFFLVAIRILFNANFLPQEGQTSYYLFDFCVTFS